MEEQDIKEKQDEQIEFNLKVMDDTDTYVFKSHNLIESGYTFTLNEQRLIYLASKKLKPKYIKSNLKPSQMKTLLANESFKDLKIHVNEFKETFGLKTNNLYSTLKDTADSLFDKSIQYMQDDGTFVKKRWVTTCKYNSEEKYVELTFHPDLILDLLVIKGRFARMEYNATKTFRSGYVFRIYELLQNYAYKGVRIFELEDLKYKLGIYDDTKYNTFRDFKRRVLVPSIDSINNSTNLEVLFNEKRHGRKVGAVEFIISQKSLTPEKHDDIEVIDKSQVEEMEKRVGCKLSAGTVAKITNITIDSIKKYKIDMSFYEYIEYQMKNVKEYAKTTGVKNLVGCLVSALSEYWKEGVDIPKSLSFHNFDAREEYSNKEYMNSLEGQLTSWQNK